MEKGETDMASKTQKVKKIRKRKSKPNPVNLETERKRIARNLEVLRKVAEGQ